MITVNEIYAFLDSVASFNLQTDFDNSGFLIGEGNSEVTGVLLALDITDQVVEEACSTGSQLIVSHHPIIFHSMKNLSLTPETKKYYTMIRNHISAICLHTNLDIAEGGVNDILLERLGLKSISALDQDQCGRIGEYEEIFDFHSFLTYCKERLNAEGLRYFYAGKPVKRIAVMGGAGASAIREAWRKECDTYLTSDIKYHDFLLAEELGINLIDADHYYTENPVIEILRQKLSTQFPELNISISKKHGQIIHFA